MAREKLMMYWVHTYKNDGSIDRVIVCPYQEDGTPTACFARSKEELVSIVMEVHSEAITQFLADNPDVAPEDIKVRRLEYR